MCEASEEWDENNVNNWATSSLKEYLNGTYFDELDSAIKSYVVSYSWRIGAIKSFNNDMGQQLEDEKANIWNGKVGLISLSDFLRVNIETESCGTYYVYNRWVCTPTNWLYLSTAINEPWMITTISSSNDLGIRFIGMTSAAGSLIEVEVNRSAGIVPVLYLSSDISLSGTGTSDDPFIIEPLNLANMAFFLYKKYVIIFTEGDMMYADVLVEIVSKNIDKTFTYKVPENTKVGMRVLVPFGKRKIEGFVLKIYQKQNFDYEVKEIIKVIDEYPVINKEMLELGKYISQKTLSSLITCYQAMLPKALKAGHKNNINKKYITILEIIHEVELNGKQLEIYNLIKQGHNIKSELNKISSYAVKRLIENNVVREIKKEVYRIEESAESIEHNQLLTNEQKNVLSKVVLNEFKPYLLYGVTGSGKTLVYIKLIEKVLKINKEAILLVPEISLTPQVVNIFKSHFGKVVAILHSALNDGEKYDEWRKIEKGEAKVVIGARSAIFAPFNNLGIIIIDEEHSSTYKQENTPRYHAIDVAVKRAQTHNCPVMMASATPSVESYTRAKAGIYTLLEMKKRVNNNLPAVTLVDMQKEIKKRHRIFSEILTTKINDRLKKHEQIIVLLNRRGFSTVVTCKECGFTHKCPNCDIPLTYHKKNNYMKCHYCNYTVPKLVVCPNCKSKNINSFGMGTEKLEELLKEKFSAKVIRMDIDTTSKKGAHEKIIKAFENKEYDILLGTQMIAKGLDFPNVTLVCVINGDSSLNIPDFRSSERTFELLNQVAGRAGRGDKKGEVIIEGFNINHYSMICASKHDYLSFYKEEMKIRKALKYPPYYNLTKITISGKNETEVNKEADKIANYLRKKLINNIILGPSYALRPKLNNIYYMQIIVKYKNTKEVYSDFVFIKNKYSKSKINVTIDLNPLKM